MSDCCSLPPLPEQLSTQGGDERRIAALSRKDLCFDSVYPARSSRIKSSRIKATKPHGNFNNKKVQNRTEFTGTGLSGRKYRLPPLPILGRSGYQFTAAMDQRHRRKYYHWTMGKGATQNPAGYFQWQPFTFPSDSLSAPRYIDDDLETDKPVTQLYDLYKPHFYHHQLGIRPINPDAASLSLLTTVDFRELKESLSHKSANDFCTQSSTFRKPHHHGRKQLNKLNPLTTLYKHFPNTTNKPSSLRHTSRRTANQLSTLLIEGPLPSMHNQWTPIASDQRVCEAISEVMLPLFKGSTKQAQVTSPFSLNRNPNKVAIKFPALVSNRNSIRSRPTSAANTRICRMKGKHLPTTQGIGKVAVGRKRDWQGISANDNISTFLPLIPMADVAAKNFPSKVKKPKKHICHQLNLKKLSDNVKNAKLIGLSTGEMPQATATTPSFLKNQSSSSYVSRSSNLRHEKKLAGAVYSFKMPNLYPDLSIVGSQFQSLQALSQMVGDVIQTTINTVNAIIETSEERLRRLRQTKKRKRHARWLNEHSLSVLQESEDSDDDLTTDSDEVSDYNMDRYLHESDFDSQCSYNSQGDYAGGDSGGSRSSRRRKKKRRRKGERMRVGSGIMKGLKHRSQKERLIERLKRKGVNVISEEEAERILMQARSDISQLKKAKHSKELVAETTRITKSGRVVKKRPKRKNKRARRKKITVPTGGAEEENEEFDGESRRHRRRQHRHKRRRRHKDHLEMENDDNELSDNPDNRTLRHRRRRRHGHGRRRRHRRHMRMGDGVNGSFDGENGSFDGVNGSFDGDSGSFDSESEGSSDWQWDSSYSCSDTGSLGSSYSSSYSSYGSYDNSDDYSDESEYSDELTDSFAGSNDTASGHSGGGGGYSGSGGSLGGKNKRSKRRKKAKYHSKGRKIGKSRNRGRKNLVGDDEFPKKLRTNDKHHRKTSSGKALRAARGNVGDGNIIDEITAALKLTNAKDDSVFEISRSGSTIFKPPTGEGRHSQSDCRRSQSGNRVSSGSDFQQQRNLNFIQKNGSVVKQKIEEEETNQLNLEQKTLKVKLARQKELEATVLSDFEMQEAEIIRRRQYEKEARRIVEQEKAEKERKEQERMEQYYERKEREQQIIMKKLEKLRNEVEKKQIIHGYHQAVVDQYYQDITLWDNYDYHYIESLMGSEYCQRIVEIDRKKRLEDAIILEQQLMESFELKRQELLLKLKQAHDKFSEKLSTEETNLLDLLDQSSRISQAFVTSYFEFVDEKQNSFLLNSFVI